MNPSVSLQCEQAMANLLSAGEATVYRSSTNEFSPEVMPLYNLVRMETDYVDGQDEDRDSKAAVDKWQLMCYAFGTGGLDMSFDSGGAPVLAVPASQAVDPLLVFAYQQLQDQTLGGLCRAVDVVGSKCFYDTRSGQDCIEVAMQIEVHYDIARLDPSANFN